MFIRKEVPLKLEILCKKGLHLIFLLILVGIPAIFILSVKNRGAGEFLLNRQNPLSVTKVIC